MPKWSEQLNHLAYVDDEIIFTTLYKRTLQIIMETLHTQLRHLYRWCKSIVKDTGHKLFNGREAHKYGRLCYRLETSLINRFCGKLKKVTLVFSLKIGHNLGPFTYNCPSLMNKIRLN
ncbi:hypothetical protein H5410_040979 [Solanum commersonii]|uniref:Uncharacterized protein n=1 Tax=Solanum commersonii TaxID=4109 RepID=A0A9J5XQI2_SOLCO|nr:hypothetical protein H5410_040979 [Solanum commersonii]